MSHVVRVTLTTDDWGDIHILRPVPRKGDSWGDLALLRDTLWGDLIAVVSGVVMSHAVRGYGTPLMREIGRPPRALLRRIPVGSRPCGQKAQCATAGPDCVPGKKTPLCYVGPVENPELAQLIGLVVVAWKEERYVIVIDGNQF